MKNTSREIYNRQRFDLLIYLPVTIASACVGFSVQIIGIQIICAVIIVSYLGLVLTILKMRRLAAEMDELIRKCGES